MPVNEYYKWIDAQYPYDMAECGECATGHANNMCGNREHAPMVKEAKKLKLLTLTDRDMDLSARRKFAAFRKKFARFYPKWRRK